MLCDKCKKNEATIHVKKVSNGKIESLHLCADCAKEKAENGVLGAFGFNLAEVLFDIDEMSKISQAKESNDSENGENTSDIPASVCSVCGWDLKKLKQHHGRLGCSNCYQTFAPVIADALKRVQRGKVHPGKRPGGDKAGLNPAALHLEMEQLKKELAACIKKEEYEQAAVCRDKLNCLKEKLSALENKESSDEQ